MRSGRLTILYKDANGGAGTRCTVDKWTFQDRVMGEQCITFSISSAVPIPFAIGDYCIYRGQNFYLNILPSVGQTAKRKRTGDAFKYDNVKFESASGDLSRVIMLDITPTTGEYVAALETNYTGSSQFQLFCGETVGIFNGVRKIYTPVCTLAGKIQANLDRALPNDGWHIYVNLETTHKVGDRTVFDTHTDDKVLSFNNTTALAALAEVQSTFKLDYFIKGRDIYIGYTLGAITGDNSHIGGGQDNDYFYFGYGCGYADKENPGRALFEIKRTANQSQQIITRLRALGSKKNMPYRYYHKHYNLSQSMFPQNLQLPDTFETPETKARNNAARKKSFPYLRSVLGDTNDAYIDKDDDCMGSVEGMREGVGMWDGSTQDLEEIYPTIKETTYGELRGNGCPDIDNHTEANSTYKDSEGHGSFLDYRDGERIDEILAVGWIDNSGNAIDDAHIGDGIFPDPKDKKKHYIDCDARIEETTVSSTVIKNTGGQYGTGEKTLFTVENQGEGCYFMSASAGHVYAMMKIISDSRGKMEVGYRMRIYARPKSTGKETMLGFCTVFVSDVECNKKDYFSFRLPDLPDVSSKEIQVPEIKLSETSDVRVTFEVVFYKNGFEGKNFSINYFVGVPPDMAETNTEFKSQYRWGELQYYDDFVNTPFHAVIKDLGIQDFKAHFVGNDKPMLVMSDGRCVAREFEIGDDVKPVSYSKGGKRYKGWQLSLKRASDTSLHTYLPSATDKLQAGDHYVLVGIEMPDAYIKAAEMRLLTAATQYLADNCETKYTYEPHLDDIYLERNYDRCEASGDVTRSVYWNLYAGLKFPFYGIPNTEEEDEVLPIVNITIETLTIKEGETLTPKVELTLNEKIEQSTYQKITTAVDRIYNGSIFSGKGGGNGSDLSTLLTLLQTKGREMFLSRQRDDEAAGKITFKDIATFAKGLAFGNGGKGIDGKGNASLGDVSGDAFTARSVTSKGYTGEDILADRGFRMWEDADGKSHVMTDYFSARVKAFFASLEIRRIEHSAGNRIESPAGNTIAMVAGYTHAAGGYRKAAQGETVAFHRCYFMAEDKEKGVTNDWRAGDQAFCQTFNLRQFRSDGTAYGVTNKRYWRLVISTGYAKIGGTEYGYIDLCNMIAWDIEDDGKVFHCVGYEDIAGIGVPESGDGVACFGSQTRPETRGGAIQYITCGEADTGGLPCVRLYSGINGFTNLSRYLIEERSPRRVMARADKFEILSAAGTGASGGMTCFRGDWQPGVEYGRYDVVQHSGSSWLCTVDEGKTTTAEPSAASPDWTLFAARGGAAPVIDCDKGSVTIEADGDGSPSSDPLNAMPERFRVIHGGLPVTALDAAATYIKYKGRSVFLDGHSAGASADGMFVSRLSVKGDGVAIMWQARFGIGSDGKEHPTPIHIHAEFVKDGERLSAGMAIPVIEQRAAREVMAEYSVTGNDGTWHTPFTEGDVFAHFSYDGGATWTDKVRIVGKSLEFKPADMHFAKWADYTEYFRTHGAAQYTVIVSEDKNGRPAPSVVRYSVGSITDGIPPSTDISAAPSGENYLTQSDGHLWNSQGAGKGWADMGRIEGKAGADGVTFVLSPATVIFVQDEKTLKVDTSGFSARVIGMSGTRMLAAGRDYSISKVTGTHCTAYTDGGLVKIRGIDTQAGVGGDRYNPSGSVDVEISGIGSQKIHLTLNWAANLLGTWKQTVRNDVMEALSNKQVTYVDKDGNTHTESLETLIRQNAEGVDLSAKVNDLETAGLHLNGKESRIDLVASQTHFVSPDGRDRIRIGEDGGGFPYLILMMPDGVTPAFNLGGMGIVQLINNSVQAGFGKAQPMRYLGTVAELGGGIGAEELYTACDGDVGETDYLHAMIPAFRFTQARAKQRDGTWALVPFGVDDDGKYYDSNVINQDDGLPSGAEICRIGYVDAPGEVTLWIGAYTSQVGYRNRPELNPSTSLTRSFPVYYVHGSRVTRVEKISVQFTVTQGRKGYAIQPLPSSGGDKYYPVP